MNEAFPGFWNDLNSYYGKNQTNPVVIGEYEKEAIGVPASKRHDLFAYIVRTHDYFPKIGEFTKACERFKPIVRQKAYNGSCVYCLGAGLIKYYKKVQGLPYKPEYFAACVCDKGRSFKDAPVKGIEEVYGPRLQEVLSELAKRNGNARNVAELQQEVMNNVRNIGCRSPELAGQLL